MLIDRKLIEQSVARVKQVGLDVEKINAIINKGVRSQFVTPEQSYGRKLRLFAETGDSVSANKALERLLGGNDLSPINYLAKGLNVARAVCRIRIKSKSGARTEFGTGFLVAPGVLMTNHHVIGGFDEASRAQADFDYELDIQGKEMIPISFSLLTEPVPIANKTLDFCLVGVSLKSDDGKQSLDDFGWLPLHPEPGKAFVGEYLTIIQHPGGERKQVCVRENRLLKYDPDGDALWYATDTVSGSSGSPVFNNSWEVVALHHSGVPKRNSEGRWLTVDGEPYHDSMDESRVAWVANEGIRISRILAFVSTNYAESSLVKAVLAYRLPPILKFDGRNNENSVRDRQRSEYADGELRVTVPVQISIRVGEKSGSDSAKIPEVVSSIPMVIPVMASDLAIEKVEIDQSNYDSRTGYDSEFLGGDGVRVPLPRFKDPKLKEQVLSITHDSDGNNETAQELRYWNYSVAMHKRRKLAIYSAVNIDANKRPDSAGRNGDKWFSDPRAKGYEIGAKFYGKQRTFELDRSENPFDRGHLTRRLDAQWGENAEDAKRNGDDTFHWTNCSPQHWQLNQGHKRWHGLEDYVILKFAKDTGRACVISGPVFDAPLSHITEDGEIKPNVNGKAHKDPTFGGVAIPKFFYKVVACKSKDGQLQVAAFLMSQEDFLRTIDRLKGLPEAEEEILTPAEARLYQVRLKDLEALTGLAFGLNKFDIAIEEKAGTKDGLTIEALEDIRM